MSNGKGMPRGLDFYRKWSQGSWAEEKLKEAINRTKDYSAYQYGPSRGEPFHTIEEFEKYNQEYSRKEDKFGKRPDLLVFNDSTIEDFSIEDKETLNELEEISDSKAEEVISSSSGGIEVETSIWKIEKRRRNGKSLSMTVKKEDYEPLTSWREQWNVPIFVVQIFFDEAYIMPFKNIEDPVEKKEENPQTSISGFYRRTDSNTGKITYFADVLEFEGVERIGEFVEFPEIDARFLERDDGKVVPYVAFKEGKLNITTTLENFFE
ncbi:hypothetical protein AKJ65_05685 [candidate division MSBL1 archaeon SCGC-AAA259E19]|uniref:Uncharacterized protein n=1 Tax=candidate division MSBL1 archaeon SCGC-AAA259E19 TaxID=1698264 RepID=A0A133UIN1_9EURY|nr:hypothetical protein AKJ65_05685 [candidate division MSBL1 archaeon SCGC-AAA259E19]